MRDTPRILLVDDTPRNLTIMEKILREYNIAKASTGEEALEMAASLRPDLILMDVMMPGINGYDTCRLLRKNVRLAHTKIIMVSARAMVSERLEGYSAGADDYITKPFDEDEFKAKVRTYLQLKSVQTVDELRRNLLAILRHETQTPLSVIHAACETLIGSANLDPEEKDLLHSGFEAVLRLEALIDRTVLMSRMKSGEVKPKAEPVLLDEMVLRCVSRQAKNAGNVPNRVRAECRVQVMVELDPRFETFVLNPVLEKILALAFPGSEIVVSVSGSDDTAEISVLWDQEEAAHQLLDLFEAFRVSDVTHHARGDGLRLALAGEWIEAHGGRLKITENETQKILSIELERSAGRAAA